MEVRPAPDGDEPTDVEANEPETLAASPSAMAGAAAAVGSLPPSASLKTGAPSEADASGPTAAHSGSATSVAHPVEAMRSQEIARTRMFTRFAGAIALFNGAFVAMVDGDPTAKVLLYAGLGAVLVSCSWLAWIIRKDEGYTIGKTLVAAYACVFGAFAGISFFGVYSPGPMILPFGLFFFSAAQSLGATISVFVTCAATYLVLGLLFATGAVHDPGLVTLGGVGTAGKVAIVAMVEITLLATFFLARATRKATIDAIERHDKAFRGLAQREALLREARQDLERALRAGDMGRFTDTTLGAFRLGKVLGRGGMGEVYEAVHLPSQRPAAVKLLHSHVLADPDMLRRFLREAKIAAQLASPHVAKVLEVGGLDDAPVPYIAMERLKGEDLADLLRRHRALSVARTVTFLREVGRGLVAARAAGIVHRDLKPRNVFHAEEAHAKRVWKILDFGVSKLMDSEGTQTKDALVGTPAYMAPEQAKGGEITYKTDLHALGVIAYRALTGRPAFAGEHTAETLYQVVYRLPPRPSAIAKLSPDVDSVIAIAMAKDPEDRFESAAEMADALESAADGRLDPALRARAERVLEKVGWAA